MGVGDRVAVTIESEFNGPPLSSAEGAGAQAAKTQ
jgi:hypothetical protein